MAVKTGKQLMGTGGHRPLVGMAIDEKELKQIINDLDKNEEDGGQKNK